ncbi:MAG TPA: aminotransferase class V-fold PLP-dependent enzyme, partial [Gemmatimonadaceae bacterium]|nr:aminotransferase class V-fold PLP-dependent enzyme [Gemmatimonadaceae bacterium]
MSNDASSHDRPATGLDRRGFLSRLAGAAAVAGAASPALDMLAIFPAPAATPGSVFRPGFAEPDAALFAEARKHFLIPRGVTYCNTGTLGASPREVVDALVNGTRALETRLAAWAYDHPEGEPLTGYEPSLAIRTAVGAFINAKPDEVAITQNATMSMNFLANGLDLSPGDEVISTDQEHGGCISPWRLKAKRYGIVVKELALDDGTKSGVDGVMKLFAEAMTPKTKAVMFSHVVSGLGTRLPARELCAMIRDHGALALVDGAQAVGQLQVDVKELGCDAYVASPHKWMMAPKGTGFLYIRRDIQDRFWTTLASSHWDDKENGAFRFMQYGTGAVPVHEGLTAALNFINKIGMPRIERWDTMLTKRLRDGLARVPGARISSPEDPRLASAITTFR